MLEYQSKSLLEKHNVAVQKFIVAGKVEDAEDIQTKLSRLFRFRHFRVVYAYV